jgi:hypothetical protein
LMDEVPLYGSALYGATMPELAAQTRVPRASNTRSI